MAPDVDVVRRHPGPGYRHVLRRREVQDFLKLLPDPAATLAGIDIIILDRGSPEAIGWYREGEVGLCAWRLASGLWHETEPEWIEENRAILDRLGVEHEWADGRVGLLWTEPQARAYMLLHVLLHELGHHHDQLSTRSRRAPARGERFADDYAADLLTAVFPAYAERFGI